MGFPSRLHDRLFKIAEVSFGSVQMMGSIGTMVKPSKHTEQKMETAQHSPLPIFPA